VDERSHPIREPRRRDGHGITISLMGEGPKAEELAAQAAEAVRRSLAEAETRAERIIGDAEAEAKRILDRAEAEARERIDSATRALEELRAKLAEVGSAPASAASASQPAQGDPVAAEPPASRPEPEPEPLRAEPEVPTAAPTEPQPAERSGNGDDAAARLVAMKLAVDGKGREEIEAELSRRFGPGDRSGMLDDVLSRAGR
jgi:vacuolar-type H+-ATPase subunit H